MPLFNEFLPGIMLAQHGEYVKGRWQCSEIVDGEQEAFAIPLYTVEDCPQNCSFYEFSARFFARAFSTRIRVAHKSHKPFLRCGLSVVWHSRHDVATGCIRKNR